MYFLDSLWKLSEAFLVTLHHQRKITENNFSINIFRLKSQSCMCACYRLTERRGQLWVQKEHSQEPVSSYSGFFNIIEVFSSSLSSSHLNPSQNLCIQVSNQWIALCFWISWSVSSDYYHTVCSRKIKYKCLCGPGGRLDEHFISEISVELIFVHLYPQTTQMTDWIYIKVFFSVRLSSLRFSLIV